MTTTPSTGEAVTAVAAVAPLPSEAIASGAGAVAPESPYSSVMAAAKAISEKNGFVYLLFFDKGYLDITKSWVCNVRSMAGVLDSTLLVATDSESAESMRSILKDRTLHVFEQTYQVTGKVAYGTYAYFRLTVERLRLQHEMIQAGVNVMIIESDAVWVNGAEATSQIVREELKENDMVAYNDCAPNARCIAAGFLAIKSTPATRAFFSAYYTSYAAYMDKFKGKTQIGDHGEQLQMTTRLSKDKSIKVQWLDTAKFCSGKWYIGAPHKWHVPAMHKRASCLVIQNNWIIGNPAKIKRAKEFGHWYLGEEEPRVCKA